MKFFSKEILFKFFNLACGIFPHFLSKIQKTRKLCTCPEIQFCKVSAQIIFTENGLCIGVNLSQNSKIFKLESDFFPRFSSKIRKIENCKNLSLKKFKCANFEQKILTPKNGLCSIMILNRNFRLYRIFFHIF